ncbi:MAG: acylphosphatase [Candidatus Caldarchaeum sp.]
MPAYIIKLHGRVQRVGLRRHVQELAQDLGLTGYVWNQRDGSVHIFVQGEEDPVEKFINALKTPPPPAILRKMERAEAKPRPKLKYFEIKYGRLADELQEGFGSMQAIFMNYWGEFRDFRTEFRDFREEFRDFREEFRDYRNEFREFAKRMDEFSERVTRVLEVLMEESKRNREILEILVRDSRETREMLNESLKMLREVASRVL